MPIRSPHDDMPDYDPSQPLHRLNHCVQEVKRFQMMLAVLFFALANRQEELSSEEIDCFYGCADSWLQELAGDLEGAYKELAAQLLE